MKNKTFYLINAVIWLAAIAAVGYGASGRIQNEDIKSSAELVAAGSNASHLPNDNKIWITSYAKNMGQAIVDEDLIGKSTTNTLTNKTINCSSNTCSNVPVNSATGVLPIANGGTNNSVGPTSFGLNYFDGTKITTTAQGASGKVLQGNGAAAPTFSTPTYPSASGTAGKILRSDGTNNAYSTATFPDTATTSDLLYASGANAWSNLAKSNSSALVSNSSGVPAWASGTTANRLLRTDGTSLTFSQAALATDVSGTLPVANGGTGQTTYTDGQLLIGNTSGNTLTKSTLTAGSNVTITNGNGSITIASTGGSGGSPTVATKTANYTMVANDYIIIDSSGGTFTLTLPTAVGVSGQSIYVHKKTSDLTAVTINTTSSQTIGDGSATSVKVVTQGEEWLFLSDNANWKISKHETDTGWISNAANTWNGMGTVSAESSWWRRVGDSVSIRGYVTTGTVAATTCSVSVSSAFTIDSTKLGSATSVQLMGFGHKISTGASAAIDGGTFEGLIYDGSDTAKLYIVEDLASNAYTKKNCSSNFSSTQIFEYSVTFPVSGWSP